MKNTHLQNRWYGAIMIFAFLVIAFALPPAMNLIEKLQMHLLLQFPSHAHSANEAYAEDPPRQGYAKE